MGIGTSDGQQYESLFHYMIGQPVGSGMADAANSKAQFENLFQQIKMENQPQPSLQPPEMTPEEAEPGLSEGGIRRIAQADIGIQSDASPEPTGAPTARITVTPRRDTSDTTNAVSELVLPQEQPSNLDQLNPPTPALDQSIEQGSKALFNIGDEKGRSVIGQLTGSDGQERYQLWPEVLVRDIVKSIYKGVTAPGDVTTGKLDPLSPEAAQRAWDLAGLMVFGPAPIASKIVDGTLGSFAGVRSPTVNRDMLNKANQMLQDGHTADQIWLITGFFKGADGRWRYEIPDQGMKVKVTADDLYRTHPDRPYTLKEVIDHPELFKAYPQLKDIKVKYDPKLNAYGEANAVAKTITLGPGSSKGTLLHEIAHIIQEIEGFNKGGAPAEHFALRFDKELKALEPGYNKLLTKYIKNKTQLGAPALTSEEESIFNTIMRLRELDMLRRPEAEKEVYKNYRILAGEVEARNVADRYEKGFTSLLPTLTEDTPRAQQKVIHTPTHSTPYGYGDPMYAPPYPKSAPREFNNPTGKVVLKEDGSLDITKTTDSKHIQTRIRQIEHDRNLASKAGIDTKSEDYAGVRNELTKLRNRLKELRNSYPDGTIDPKYIRLHDNTASMSSGKFTIKDTPPNPTGQYGTATSYHKLDLTAKGVHVEAELTPTADSFYLKNIYKYEGGKGVGTEAYRELAKWAADRGKPLEVYPSRTAVRDKLETGALKVHNKLRALGELIEKDGRYFVIPKGE